VLDRPTRGVRASSAAALLAVTGILIAGCGLAFILSATAQAADQDVVDTPVKTRTVLVLPFDMVDTSLQGELNGGPLESDVKRLGRTEAIARRSLNHLDAFETISREPVSARITQAQNTYRYLYSCNGCDVKIGRAAGADLVMTGWVQKVSNLILNVNATLRRTDTGAEVGGGSVSMRSNTDDSWRSAALYLIEHTLLDNYRSRASEDAEISPSDNANSPPAEVPVHHYPG